MYSKCVQNVPKLCPSNSKTTANIGKQWQTIGQHKSCIYTGTPGHIPSKFTLPGLHFFQQLSYFSHFPIVILATPLNNLKKDRCLLHKPKTTPYTVLPYLFAT